MLGFIRWKINGKVGSTHQGTISSTVEGDLEFFHQMPRSFLACDQWPCRMGNRPDSKGSSGPTHTRGGHSLISRKEAP